MLGYGYGYGSPFYMFWDPTYVLILIGVVLSLIASAMVRRNFARYSVVRSASGLTGAQVAQRILSYAGINDVTVCHISGNLTDHYNPRTKQIGLSDSVYGSNSVAAIAVAAHGWETVPPRQAPCPCPSPAPAGMPPYPPSKSGCPCGGR